MTSSHQRPVSGSSFDEAEDAVECFLVNLRSVALLSVNNEAPIKSSLPLERLWIGRVANGHLAHQTNQLLKVFVEHLLVDHCPAIGLAVLATVMVD